MLRNAEGDLNNLLQSSDRNRKRVRDAMKRIKGVGDLGVDVFLDNVQAVWPAMAPTMDARSLQTAEEVGVGTDLDAIYAELDEDPVMMSRLANVLSMVRLEKKVGSVEEELSE